MRCEALPIAEAAPWAALAAGLPCAQRAGLLMELGALAAQAGAEPASLAILACPSTDLEREAGARPGARLLPRPDGLGPGAAFFPGGAGAQGPEGLSAWDPQEPEPPVSVGDSGEPLAPLLRVSAARRREGALAYALGQVEDHMYEIYFDLQNKSDAPAALARMDKLFAAMDEGPEDRSDPDRHIKRWLAYADAIGYARLFDYLDETHCGDCCAIPASCARCYAEGFIGVDTAPRSKAEGHRMWAAYRAKLSP